MEAKYVFPKSGGWLLFWLIILPPVGYIWLIFSLRRVDAGKFKKGCD